MMRNQSLTGFAIHQRRYRERSYILHFFSEEFGRVDGVTRQQPPALYHRTQLQATGKSELKNFSQIDVQGQPFYLQQKALFAGFYLNEILLRLMPPEEPMPDTYQAYQTTLEKLKNLAKDDPKDLQLKLILRQFEQIFLQELGYAIDFSQDANGQDIAPTVYYQFIPQEGFVIGQYGQNFLGQDLLNLAQSEQINSENVSLLAKLYRLILTELLGNKPLKSRQLWVSQLHQN
ncbi:DNA repair protein RecO [Acinetobacter sp.]|uniref:DNA repair protein RecO n=1 Tax=Acinetobacter sp. TaxID=472 RepID=UPI0035B0AAEC